jgi:hypothetical protein
MRKGLTAAIAKKASELVALLGRASAISGDWPSELYSMHALLEATSGSDLLWPGLRKHVLGDVSQDLRYIWSTAPSVPECLKTMSVAAQLHTPKETGMIGAAVSKRQQNPKTEYIRALGTKLREYKIGFSTNVIKAMAITTSVALNDEGVDVSVQDVRQALA